MEARRATMPPALTAAGLENAQASMVRRKQGQDQVSMAAAISPSSPTTTVVRRMVKAQPNVAIVHTVSLKDGLDVPMPRNVSTPDLKQRPRSGGVTRSVGEMVIAGGHSRNLARRPSLPANFGSAAALREPKQFPSGLLAPPIETSNIRVLEPWEVADRTQHALDFFKEAKQINRKVRTIEDTEMMLAEARKRRSESRSQSKQSTVGQSAAAIGASRIQEAMAHRAATGQAKSSSGQVEASEKPPERKMTLAEKMGYGVKTSQAEDKFAVAATVAHAAVKLQKGKDVFRGVSAGNNTLKERLAKRRATVS